MLSVVLQSSGATGFDISTALLLVLSLLLPAIVFLVGVYQDREGFDGPFSRLFNRSATSFGTAIGLQALAIAILGILANVYYIVFNQLFTGFFSLGIAAVGIVSTLAIVSVSVCLLMMIYGLTTSRPVKAGDEISRHRDDVDKTILKQEKEQLRNEVSRQKQVIADMTTQFRRLEILLERNDYGGSSEVRELFEDDHPKKTDNDTPEKEQERLAEDQNH